MSPKSLEILQNNEHFLEFLNALHDARENWIANLQDRPTDMLQCIAGRICTLDDILEQANYKAVKERWDALKR
jgi:hypothetical protein